MKRFSRFRTRETRRRATGFTILEVLIALAVVGVAATVATSLYVASLNVSQLARSESVASSLAEAKLLEIAAAPKAFTWGDGVQKPVGQSFPVRAAGVSDDKPQPYNLVPSALGNGPESLREKNFYGAFEWSAFARIPEQGAQQAELTVVIDWRQAGRMRRVALTSAVPRSTVEGRS